MNQVQKEQMIEDASTLIGWLLTHVDHSTSTDVMLAQVRAWQDRYSLLQWDYAEREKHAITEEVRHWNFCGYCAGPLERITPREGAAWEKRCATCQIHTFYRLGNRGRVSQEWPDGSIGDMVNTRVHLHDGSPAEDQESEG